MVTGGKPGLAGNSPATFTLFIASDLGVNVKVLEHFRAIELEYAFGERIGQGFHQIITGQVFGAFDILGITLLHHQFQLVVGVDHELLCTAFLDKFLQMVLIHAGKQVGIHIGFFTIDLTLLQQLLFQDLPWRNGFHIDRFDIGILL